VNVTSSYYSWELDAPVPLIGAIVTAGSGAIRVYVVSGSADGEAACTIHLRAMMPRAASHCYVSSESLNDGNTFDQPSRVRIQRGKAEVRSQQVIVKLSPHPVSLTRILG